MRLTQTRWFKLTRTHLRNLTMGGSPAGRNPLTEEFKQLALRTLKEWKVPGLSIAVVDGHSIYTDGYGLASVSPPKPATPSTIYCGASTTKAFTAAFLSHWIHDKRHPSLSPKGWQTPISSLIRDDFVLQDEWATTHTTLEDAACHRTGLAGHNKTYIHSRDNGGDVTPRDVVRNLRNLTLTAEPRTKFQYCNPMYTTLSHVLETLGGKRLGELLADDIWQPLGMDSTKLDVRDVDTSRLATGYYWDEASQEYHAWDPIPLPELSGAGAILSSVSDYALWLRCLLHQSGPLSQETHEDIRTPRMQTSSSGGGSSVSLYGLGWFWSTLEGQAVYSHSGGLHAFGAEVLWMPGKEFGVVVMANTAGSSNAVGEILAYKLMQDFLGVPETDQYKPGPLWREEFKQQREKMSKAVDIVYPDRPEKPLHSSCSVEDLAGSYHDEGYGTLHFQVHRDEKTGKQVLVADCTERTWQWRYTLVHVSGDWWLAYVTTPKSPDELMHDEFLQAKFHVGPDGKSKALAVDFLLRLTGLEEGRVTFRRVKEGQ